MTPSGTPTPVPIATSLLELSQSDVEAVSSLPVLLAMEEEVRLLSPAASGIIDPFEIVNGTCQFPSILLQTSVLLEDMRTELQQYSGSALLAGSVLLVYQIRAAPEPSWALSDF
jgi:hypothetical protein